MHLKDAVFLSRCISHFPIYEVPQIKRRASGTYIGRYLKNQV